MRPAKLAQRALGLAIALPALCTAAGPAAASPAPHAGFPGVTGATLATRAEPLTSGHPVPAGWPLLRQPALLPAATTPSPSRPVEGLGWAGYLDVAAHGRFDGVTGAWSVPVLATAKLGYSATWVGTDVTSPQYGLEAGTEQDWGPAGLVYYAWYRLGANAPVQLGQVFPGDAITVALARRAGGAWTVTLDDQTSFRSWSGAVSDPAPGNSAGWVEAAPASPSQGVPLANFGTVQFSHLAVSGPGARHGRAVPLYMVDHQGAPVEAYPSRYDARTDSFDVSYGRVTPKAIPFATLVAPVAAPPALAPPASPSPAPLTGPGYRLAAPDGGVFAFGGEHFAGSASAAESGASQNPSPGAMAAQLASGGLAGPVAAIASTPDRGGYWLATDTGGIFAFGDAHWYGSLPSMGGAPAIVSAIAPTPDGRGYWLLSLSGGVYAFGDARYAGSCSSATCAFPAVRIVPDGTGRGYWLLLANCQMVPFGDAPHIADPDCQSAAGTTFTAATDAVATPDRQGYWAMLGDGTIYAEGDAKAYGTWPASAQTVPGDVAIALLPTPDDRGAWLVFASGYVEDLGDAPNLGSLEATVLEAPVVTATT